MLVWSWLALAAAAQLATGQFVKAPRIDKRSSIQNPDHPMSVHGVFFGGSSIERNSGLDRRQAFLWGASTPSGLVNSCDITDNLLICAQKMTANYTIIKNNYGAPYQLQADVNLGDKPEQKGYIIVNVRLAAENCQLSQPYISYRGETMVCNTEECRVVIDYSISRHNNKVVGHDVGVDVNGGTSGFLPFAKSIPFSVGFSAGGSTNWGSSYGNSTTQSFTTSYFMVRGDVCSPATIQLSVNCAVSMQATDSQWTWVPYNAGQAQNSDTMIDCEDSLNTLPRNLNPDLAQICASLKNPKNSTLDIPSPGSINEPWSLKGCLYNGNDQQ